MTQNIAVSPSAQALIFDIDGTLADTMPTHFKAYRKILGEYGVDFTHELFLSFAGMPVIPQMYKIKEMFNPSDFIPEQVAAAKEDLYYKSIDTTQAIKEVVDVFNRYYGKMPIACGTGGERRIANRTLEVIGLFDKVDAIVTSDDVVHGKPNPETFLKCANLLNVEPVFCQVFEDADPGIEAAKAAGMIVCDIRKYL